MDFVSLFAILVIYGVTLSVIGLAIRYRPARKAHPMRIVVSHVISLDPKLSLQIDKLIDALSGGIDQELEKALEERATALEALTQPKEN